jgi:hypothetical protein
MNKTTQPNGSSLRKRTTEALLRLSTDDPSSVEALRPLYAADMIFEDPLQRLQGLEPFLAMNRKLLKMAKVLRFELRGEGGDDREFFLAWRLVFKPKLGPTAEVDGVSHIKSDGARIQSHVDYWDIASLLASLVPGGRRLMRAALRPFV